VLSTLMALAILAMEGPMDRFLSRRRQRIVTPRDTDGGA
jgi:hypothetical protein